MFAKDTGAASLTGYVLLPVVLQAGTMTSFQVATFGCPPGYILAPASVSDYFTCNCDFDNPDIVNCDDRDIILDVSGTHTHSSSHTHTHTHTLDAERAVGLAGII